MVFYMGNIAITTYTDSIPVDFAAFPALLFIVRCTQGSRKRTLAMYSRILQQLNCALAAASTANVVIFTRS